MWTSSREVSRDTKDVSTVGERTLIEADQSSIQLYMSDMLTASRGVRRATLERLCLKTATSPKVGIVAEGECWVNMHKSCSSDTLTPSPLKSLCVHSHILFPVVHLQPIKILTIDVAQVACKTARAQNLPTPLNHTGNFETTELDVTKKKNIKKQLLQYTKKASETVQTVERAEKAWRHIVVGPDDCERARDQAFDQHAKGTLFDDDRSEPEPDGDAVDEVDPLGDELSDGEEDDTVEDHPSEYREHAQHDDTVKPGPPPEDTDTLPEPAVPVTTMLSRLAALRIVYGSPTDRDLQAAASSGAQRES